MRHAFYNRAKIFLDIDPLHDLGLILSKPLYIFNKFNKKSKSVEKKNISYRKKGQYCKGQYHIVLEVLLILIGILITGYVISIFTDVKTGATSVVVSDNFNIVADQIIVGLVKVSTTPNSIERIKIPERIADVSYRITLDSNQITVSDFRNSRINATRQIFNIDSVNRISRSEVVSSALVVEVVAENGNIKIRRGS